MNESIDVEEKAHLTLSGHTVFSKLTKSYTYNKEYDND